MKRLGLILLAGGVIAALALLYWRLAPGVTVQVAPAEVAPLRQFVEEQAQTRLPRDYVISMPYAGRVDQLALEVGDPVYRGQTIARLVEKDLELRLQEATEMVARMEASLRESRDLGQEQVMLQQAKAMVTAMADTVRAAAAREVAGRARFDVAERVRNRSEQLFQSGSTTEEALDQARLSAVESSVNYEQDKLVHSAAQALFLATASLPPLVEQMIARRGLSANVVEQQLQEARRRVDEVRLEVSRGTMKSPIDGVVLERAVFNEQTLSAGALLLRIGDLGELEIEADILSQDVVQIEPGDPVQIVGDAIGSEPAQGEVFRIYPAGFTKISSLGVEEQRVKVIVRFAPEELERLRQERSLGVGYRVWVRVIVDEKADALQIPRTAIFRDTTGNWQVLVVRNNLLETQSVTLGLIGPRMVEITEGLKAGDRVVVAPESNLAPGLKVSPVERNLAPSS